MHRLRFILIFGILSALVWIFGANFSGLPEVSDLSFRLENIEQKISTPAPLRGQINSPEAFLTRAGVAQRTNAARTEEHLPILTPSSKLNTAALAKVRDMFNRQYFAHVSPVGESASDLVSRAGYEYISVGENLALGNFEDDEALVQAWMDSPGHRANILGERFTEIGVAVAEGQFEGQTTWLAVQIFALPRSACPSVDGVLKNRIDTNESRLDQLQGELDDVRRELDAIRPRWGEEYNAKVQEYNVLVNSYNALLQETKDLIASYNAQVRDFNVCLNE